MSTFVLPYVEHSFPTVFIIENEFKLIASQCRFVEISAQAGTWHQ